MAMLATPETNPSKSHLVLHLFVEPLFPKTMGFLRLTGLFAVHPVLICHQEGTQQEFLFYWMYQWFDWCSSKQLARIIQSFVLCHS